MVLTKSKASEFDVGSKFESTVTYERKLFLHAPRRADPGPVRRSYGPGEPDQARNSVPTGPDQPIDVTEPYLPVQAQPRLISLPVPSPRVRSLSSLQAPAEFCSCAAVLPPPPLPSFAAAARRAPRKDSTMVQKKKKAAAPAKLRKPPKRDAVAILQWPKISRLDPPREQEDLTFLFSLFRARFLRRGRSSARRLT